LPVHRNDPWFLSYARPLGPPVMLLEGSRFFKPKCHMSGGHGTKSPPRT
jgi:hypothetical protein